MRDKSTSLLLWGLVGLGLAFSGCQSISAVGATDVSNDKFMFLWQRYNECKVAPDFHSAHAELKELSSAASMNNNPGFVLPLPAKLKRFISAPTNRLAVDIQAMRAACSLHAGQLALHEGRIEAARSAFSSVVSLQKEISPYYVLQAKRRLTELEQGISISFKTP